MVVNKTKLMVPLLILGLVIGICIVSGLRLSQPRPAFDLMILLAFVSMLIWTIGESHTDEKGQQTSELKLKKCYLLFFILYLITLFLGGGTRMTYAGSVLSKMTGFLWSLAPSQTFNWWFISLTVSMILIILGFVAGCILITHFVRKEDQRRVKNTLLYIVQTPVALLAAIMFSTWLWLPDWTKKIWYRFWMRAQGGPEVGVQGGG